MELLIKQCEYNKEEEPCEESAPKKDSDENIDLDLYEYDYYKRIWF